MARSEQALRTERSVDAIRVAAGRHALLEPIARGFARAAGAAGLAPGARLLLLVSGGGDSMALLVAAVALAEREPTGLSRLAVLSVDHGLRAGSADEVAFVAEWARALGVAEVATERVGVAAGGNLLASAREARYLAARRWQRRLGCAAMVTAHQAEDRAETALLALARGGAADAVVGARWARLRGDLEGTANGSADGGGDASGDRGESASDGRREADGTSAGDVDRATGGRAPAPWLLRPLLGVTRAELRGMLGELGVPWIDDPSNAGRSRGAMRADPASAAWIEAAAARGGAALDEFEQLLAWREREVARLEVARLEVECLGVERLEGRWSGGIPRAELEALDPALRVPVVQAFLRRRASNGRRSPGDGPASEDLGEAARRTLHEIADAIGDGARHPRRWRVSAELEVVLDRAGLSLAVSPRAARER